MEEKNVSSCEGLKCHVTATTESISPTREQRESKVECPEDEDKKKGEVRDDNETPGTSQTKKTDWAEEEFWKPIEYFADDCNLPNEGLMPNDVPKTLVSDEVLLDVEKEKLNTSTKVMPDSTSAMDTIGLSIGEGSGAGGTDAMAFPALSSSVITDEQKIVTCVASAIRSTMPEIEYLKREILDSEEKGQVTRDEIDRLSSDITKFSEQLDTV
ncbi:hypothetical protein R1sor_012709 [Riccia sorocarpa]|uniref:Uncharacterized protein n=1 Tax=Riccia sorocarpa TaxID=122646 RepID=A0ABD3I4W3_9MARC